MPRARPAAALPKCYRFNRVCGMDTVDVKNPLDTDSPINMSLVICLGTHCHQGERQRDMSSEETLSTFRRFWLKHYDAVEVLTMATLRPTLCQHRGRLPLVCDLETPCQNDVTERHGAFFKMAFENACSYETHTTEALLQSSNRSVGRAGFALGQESFWGPHEIATQFAGRRLPGPTSRGRRKKTAQTDSTWRASVHASKTRWNSRMVWSI